MNYSYKLNDINEKRLVISRHLWTTLVTRMWMNLREIQGPTWTTFTNSIIYVNYPFQLKDLYDTSLIFIDTIVILIFNSLCYEQIVHIERKR